VKDLQKQNTSLSFWLRPRKEQEKKVTAILFGCHVGLGELCTADIDSRTKSLPFSELPRFLPSRQRPDLIGFHLTYGQEVLITHGSTQINWTGPVCILIQSHVSFSLSFSGTNLV
jgi:hypothetical protein